MPTLQEEHLVEASSAPRHHARPQLFLPLMIAILLLPWKVRSSWEGLRGEGYEVSERLSDFSQATQWANAKAGIYTKFKGLVKFIFQYNRVLFSVGSKGGRNLCLVCD